MTSLLGPFSGHPTWESMIMLRLLACLVAIAPPASSEAHPPPIGSKIPGFELRDFRGKKMVFPGEHPATVTVLAFLGTECPIVRLYAGRLQSLADRYRGAGVVVWGIDANRQDSLAEIEHFARVHQVRFPILRDPGNRVADALGASRTPEFFVLDTQQRLRYHGRFDDQYTYETQRDTSRHHYVRDAIDAILQQRPVPTPETEVVGCHIGRVFTEVQDRGVTYCRQVRRILQRRCEACHREGEIAPFALTQYEEVAGWAPMIDEVVQQQRMPPWHASPDYGQFANDRRMTAEERQLIHQWVADGAPQGDPTDLPPDRSYTQGWQLPQPPDATFAMDSHPFQVPATGTIRYQYFSVDPGIKTDRWVSAAEVVPGNRRVVHHVLVFAQPPGTRGFAAEQGGFLAAYVPGLRAQPYPQGMAKRIAAGSKLVFQVHYTPVGTAQPDISRIGLVFAKASDVTHEVRTLAAVNTRFTIPPRASNFQVTAESRRAPAEVQLLAMMPHMHLRGKSFRYEARYLGGAREILLDVPAYDFNWQTAYRLRVPKKLPPGTRIHCTAHFDNSEANLANPDPDHAVTWGDQTWDEMMIGYFDIAIPRR